MKGIVLAAGKGSRIGSDHLGFPKSFLEINGKKIVRHQVDALRAAGVRDIVIVVGYKNWLFAEEFQDEQDVTLVKNPFYEFCNVLGSLWFAREYMEEGFFFMHADTIYDEGILSQLKEATGSIRFAVEYKKTEEEEMKVRVDQGRVVEVNKTMPCERAQGEFTGVALISKGIAPKLRRQVEKMIELDKDLQSFFEKAIQNMLDSGDVEVEAVDISPLRSIEIDFLEDYERAQQTFGRG